MTKTKRAQFKWMRFIFEGKLYTYCLDIEGELYSRQRSTYWNRISSNKRLSEQTINEKSETRLTEELWLSQQANTEYNNDFDTLGFCFVETDAEEIYFPATNDAPGSNFDLNQNDDDFFL